MKRIIFTMLSMFFIAAPLHAGVLDDALKGVKLPGNLSGSLGGGKGIDDSTAIAGIKEALTIGTANAVDLVSPLDGYFANQAIKILLPENVRKGAEALRAIGYGKQVDEFVLSMNRAAEAAAPKAKAHFVSAIKAMSFEDAKKILSGGDTAATEFFKGKTSNSLFEEFKPIVGQAMDQVGVTRSYKEMTGKFAALPFMKAESIDLDRYVTTRALDGLFYMVGQEEKKIRTNPAARVTDLLKTVFGK